MAHRPPFEPVDIRTSGRPSRPSGSVWRPGADVAPVDPTADTLATPASAPPATLRAGLAGLSQGAALSAAAPSSSAAGEELAAMRRYAPGDVLAGRYRLMELIGEGSMGAVWKARNLALNLDVALKLIRRDCAVPEAAARLLREAQATARVSHRAAVRIFDLSATEEGEPFVVMELLHGRSLAQVLAESGPLSPISSVQLLLPVIGALCAAHGAGVVHRDVKPANVVLVREGRRTIPKLIDFGIAFTATRAVDGGRDALVGSPAYMAPEQVRGGQESDARSDVWSVCVVLYELVSGRRPFGGPGSISIVHDVLRLDPPRPDAFEAHARLWEIVARGLSKAPEDRFPTMAALGRALAQWAIACGVSHDVTGASLVDYWLP
ncbi:serine/threonine-protein kinase [Sorangium sp. So ce1024]|uniref:serine/threonine-protein kinase n=1 Tax=Sorangium sp. So ce1024 TaxID=3133327 RepID=UPI003F03A84B